MTRPRRSPGIPALGSAALALALLCTPRPGFAQDASTEAARAEFMAGVACVEQHETACAESHFRAALALRDAPAVRYNLASALFELNRYPEADRLAQSVVDDESTPPDVAEAAAELRAQMTAEGGTLSIEVNGTRAEDSVHLDDEALPDSQLAATPVSAGAHHIHVDRDGERAGETSVTVGAGERLPVSLQLSSTAEELAAQEAQDGGDPGLLGDWRFWLGVGGAVAVMAIVITIAVVASENASLEEPLVGNTGPGVLTWD